MSPILHPHTMDLKIPEKYRKGVTVKHEIVSNQGGVIVIRSYYGQGLIVEYQASPERCSYKVNLDTGIGEDGLPTVL